MHVFHIGWFYLLFPVFKLVYKHFTKMIKCLVWTMVNIFGLLWKFLVDFKHLDSNGISFLSNQIAMRNDKKFTQLDQ
ncbi:hypothetical protein PGTUg99_030672 [Puccinia graminis f. sp. tritici]|uniref:Uncharacterized protein n=1 Tax=Puccinia graminis f. sp. tritici TaxID=56615 RepID=A0A5B0PLJ5_PUCGR|nr:hypothetical protein PGTUg99_030672 [Puccinia graminis f. sp. tritici]